MGIGEIGGARCPVDYESSQEAFEKVREGLDGKVGEVVLLKRPGVSGSYRDGGGGEDFYDNFHTFGILSGEPRMSNQREIVLPMNNAINFWSWVSDASYNSSDSVIFNCRNPGRLKINSGANMSLYTGEDTIKGFILGSEYVLGLKLIGEDVSAELASSYEVDLKEEATNARSSFVSSVLGSLNGKSSSVDIEHACCGFRNWGTVEDLTGNLSLGGGIYVTPGEFMRNHLKPEMFRK